MKRAFTLNLLLTLGMLPCLFAQSGDVVLLRTGARLFPENVKTYPASVSLESDEVVDGNYYRLLQFYELPSQSTFNLLAENGIELLEYVPRKTYVASIPTQFDAGSFASVGVRSIQPIALSWKFGGDISPFDRWGNFVFAQNLPAWSVEKGRALLMLKFYKNISHSTALRYCSRDGIEVLNNNGINNFLKIAVPLDRVHEVAKLPYVAFVEPVPEPSAPDDVLGRSLHRSNIIDVGYPSGRHYSGEGVNVLVRDDGMIGPHIDFKGRFQNEYSLENAGSHHGDQVAGSMGGAGNLNPLSKGMAAGAYIFSSDYEETFLDETMDIHLNKNVLVTNSSYTNGCNDYTEITETIDQQLFNNPSLMHVFSSGNANGSNCGYGAGTEWGNISGGHKQAKNCLTVANLWSNSQLSQSSSRGPAFDGRIKPDISGMGTDVFMTFPENSYTVNSGTSFSAPALAGILAQIHQAYSELNNGEVAEAALLKAILLNTANDLGNSGPDFKFGWGQVNAYRAVLALEGHQYLKSAILPDETVQHIFNIPAGVKEARFMVYWQDQEGTVLASKALVNDLDISLTEPGNIVRKPWLLNPTPDPNLLNAPATSGTDTLNNMEQIVLSNPATGDYTLQVWGKELPFGAHSYFVTWEYRTGEITLTHPVGNEGFAPGDTVRIHWDAQGDGSSFQVEYSPDGGSDWTSIATPVSSSRMTDWTIPNTITGKAKIRVSRDGFSDENDVVFSIAPRPKNVKAEKACPDFIRLNWDAVNLGAASPSVSYEILMLGDKYMEPVDTVNSTFAEIPTIDMNPSLDYWFAVRTLGEGGIRSERTIAILHNAGLVDCTQNVDVKLTSLDAPASGNIFTCGSLGLPVKIAVQNTGLTSVTNLPVSYQVSGELPVVEFIPGDIAPGEIKTYTFGQNIEVAASGEYEIQVGISAPGEVALFDNLITSGFLVSVYPGSGEPLEYQEDFEGPGFPPPFFLINNPDNSFTWDSIKVVGSNGDSTVCPTVNFFDYSNTGQVDEFLVVPIDLTNATGPQLNFDVAYARYPGYTDGLRVEVSTDCGASFSEVVYEKFGDNLETVPDQTSRFFPASASHWRKETIFLTPFTGQSVVVKFSSINGYGNALMVDNINVQNVVAPVASFTQSDTVICQGQSIVFSNTTIGEAATFQWNFGTGTQPATSTASGPVTVKFNGHGTFTPTLTVANAGGQSTFSSEVIVEPLPVAAFSWADNLDGSVTFTNDSQYGVTFSWDFGDGDTLSSADATVAHAYAAFGSYLVKLTVSNGCGSKTITKTVNVLNTSTYDLTGFLSAFVQPNPNAGNFDLVLKSVRQEQLQISLLDVRGVILEKREIQMLAGNTSAHFEVEAAPGLYFLKIGTEKGATVLKIIIQ